MRSTSTSSGSASRPGASASCFDKVAAGGLVSGEATASELASKEATALELIADGRMSGVLERVLRGGC